MQLRYLILTLAAALSLVLGIGLPAAASQQQVCGNGGSGYCLNDWNGIQSAGTAIKMYYGNSSNEQFYEQSVYACVNGTQRVDTVEANGGSEDCPFANITDDEAYAGEPIVQIAYGNGHYCVASSGSYKAVLGTCADPSNGSGASDGVIMIAVIDCAHAPAEDLVDRYASDNNRGDSFYLDSGGAPGNQAFYSEQSATCWGGSLIFKPGT